MSHSRRSAPNDGFSSTMIAYFNLLSFNIRLTDIIVLVRAMIKYVPTQYNYAKCPLPLK